MDLKNSHKIKSVILLIPTCGVLIIHNYATVSNNDNLALKARFANKSITVFMPINTIASIYTGENNEDIFFETEEQKPT